MQLQRWLRFFAVPLTLTLAFAGVPPQAAAQGGRDNVTFWDDDGYDSTTANIIAPGDLAAAGYTNVAYLNPSGGREEDDNMLVILAELGVQIVRGRDWQLFYPSLYEGTMEFTLYADGQCFNSGYDCAGNEEPSLGTLVQTSDWDSETIELLEDGPTTWIARSVESVTRSDRTYTLTATYSYTPPSGYVDIEAVVTVTPTSPDTMYLYLNSDFFLDWSDKGPGFIGRYDGNLLVAQKNDTGVGGIAETGRAFDSYFEGRYGCNYGGRSLRECGNTAAHWAVDETDPDHWFGPGFGEPYPMPAIVDGRSEGVATADVDAGVAAHWDITTNRTVTASLFFSSREAFEEGLLAEPTPTPDEAVTPAPAVCELTPDIAVDPQFINLAPGGRAVVTVSMRNLCNDAPLRSSDLLFSLSDGLRVVGGSDGLVNLGQRAALQGFALGSGETRSWTFEVEAGASLPTAPIFVVELYQGSNVTSRIDGVFLTPAPAAVEPAPTVVEQAPVVEPAPTASAPLPTALPNTAAGETSIPVTLIGTVVLSLTAGVLLLRRRRA